MRENAATTAMPAPTELLQERARIRQTKTYALVSPPPNYTGQTMYGYTVRHPRGITAKPFHELSRKESLASRAYDGDAQLTLTQRTLVSENRGGPYARQRSDREPAAAYGGSVLKAKQWATATLRAAHNGSGRSTEVHTHESLSA